MYVRHGEKMDLIERDGSDSYGWVCQKFGVNAYHVKRTVRKGSWFDESKSSMPEVMILTYLWVKKTSNEWIVDEMNASEPTVVDWKSFCREVCVDMLENDSKDMEMLGDVGVIVEIDGSKFGKRKYNKGKRVDGETSQQFKEQYPDVSTGRSKFCDIRPEEICPRHETP
ncbi:hypothetical protein AVEN_255806-1 [Araneus ventricosus]|uniref:Uncharacterized protein n=1 Tax=Araneus ventricosus TaxID=182803 RepID=A0A4Y2LXH5_ARAVE|nr:hypothetical protein AVEN_255806-1 [Araneus ventricosus]